MEKPILSTEPEMCLSLEHQTRRKPLKKMVILIALKFRYTFYLPQTKRLRDRFTLQFVHRSPFALHAMRQQGYGLRLLIFKMANNKVDLA